MNLHKKAPWEYAGHTDHMTHPGPELRPVREPFVHPAPALKSKRPTPRPDGYTATGTSRGYRRLGGE